MPHSCQPLCPNPQVALIPQIALIPPIPLIPPISPTTPSQYRADQGQDATVRGLQLGGAVGASNAATGASAMFSNAAMMNSDAGGVRSQLAQQTAQDAVRVCAPRGGVGGRCAARLPVAGPRRFWTRVAAWGWSLAAAESIVRPSSRRIRERRGADAAFAPGAPPTPGAPPPRPAERPRQPRQHACGDGAGGLDRAAAVVPHQLRDLVRRAGRGGVGGGD